jgi:hypothetical protein
VQLQGLEFIDNPLEWLLEFELLQQDLHPEADGKEAFGN